MAVAVIIDIPGGTEQQYERIIARVLPEGHLAEAWLVHIAGPTDSGWRVVNVVRSQEQVEAFAREELIPAMQQVRDPAPRYRSSPSTR